MAVRALPVSWLDEPMASGPMGSLDNVANNLPLQLTTFVGRRTELNELRDLIAATRLLSLNGAGGCGKTRLALQLAAEVGESYPGGVWLAELAPIGDPDRVLATVASALGERDLAGDLVEAIVSRLGDRATLVVFDNCEHLLGPISTLVDALLRRCPNLTVVATSREPLGVPGETGWRVPSLSAPAPAELVPVETLSEFDAVCLFVERATKARPNFRLTNDNAVPLVQICHRLDGIPLAIELAAARVRGLTVEQVAGGLDDRFRLLTGGARTVLPRQQTLQASVDWGFELLSEAERAVFRRLAVFAGGFTLDAAEQVAAGEGVERVEVLDVLLGLVDKSMVVADDDSARYRMLETLRQYGTARLVEAGETPATRDRHLDWALTLFDPVAIRASGDISHLVEVGFEVDNLRAAFEWAVIERDADAARTLSAILCVWETDRGDAAEAVRIGERGVAMEGGQPRLLAVAIAALIMAHFELGAFDATTTDYDALLAALDLLDPDDAVVRAGCLRMLSFAPFRGAHVTEHLEEAIRLAQAAGLTATVEVCTSQLAVLTAMRGRGSEARTLADQVNADPARTISGQNALMARVITAQFTGNFDEARGSLDTLGVHVAERTHPRLAAHDEAIRVLLDLSQGCDSGAAARVETVLNNARRRGSASGIATAGWAPGTWALAHGDIQMAVELLSAWRAEVPGTYFLGRTWSSVGAQAMLAAGRVGDARAEVEHTRATTAAINVDRAMTHGRLSMIDAIVTRAEGDIGAAEQLQHEALAAQHELGWRPEVAHSLEALAGIACTNESYIECARLAGAAQQLRDEMGYVLRWPYEQQLLVADLTATSRALGNENFTAAFDEGRALDAAAAVAYAQRARGERKRPTSGWASLTPTESDVVRLVAEGLTNKQIGETLFIGGETVKTHLTHVYDKLGVRNRTALTAQAIARTRTTNARD
jgi:predicted ATPase/DNA-binding CsgD family transcriptional regulator